LSKIGKLFRENQLLYGATILMMLYYFTLFKSTGALFVIGILILAVPLYLIINMLKLDATEKIMLAFPLSVGIYSSFVYYLGFLFDSIRIAILITFFLLLTYHFLMLYLQRRNILKNEAVVLAGLLLILLIVWLLAQYLVINNIPEPDYITRYLECLESNPLVYCNLLY